MLTLKMFHGLFYSSRRFVSSSSLNHTFIIEVTKGFHSNENEQGALGPLAGGVLEGLAAGVEDDCPGVSSS